MKVVGKHTLEVFDRRSQLIDRRESYNLVTTKGRERILDIWAANFGPSGSHCGYQVIDTTPTAVAGGTRRCTMTGAGQMADPNAITGFKSAAYRAQAYNFNAYDSAIAYGSTVAAFDPVFTPGNNTIVDMKGNITYDQHHHSVDMMRVDTEDEQYTVAYPGGISNHVINLVGSNLKCDYASDKLNALKVQNSSKTVTYTLGTVSTGDYFFNRATGALTIRYGGAIANGTAIKVTYKWHDTSPFADGVVGIYMRCWPWANYPQTESPAIMGEGKFSGTGGETWEFAHWPWEGRPKGTFFTWSSSYVIASNLSCAFAQDGHDRYWLTHPYVMNRPTNFGFYASFQTRYLSLQRLNFLKPVWHKMTPRVIAVGSGSTGPSAGNTALDNEVARFDCLYVDRPSNGLGRWRAYIDYDECVGTTFREVGLFHGDEWRNSTAAGWTYVRPPVKTECSELFCRTLYDTPVEKTSDMRMELRYELELV
jgi:hypothetical protein